MIQRVLVTLLLLGSGISFAQSSVWKRPPVPIAQSPWKPPPPALVESGTPKPVQVPQFTFWGVHQCDDESNVYAHAAPSFRAKDVLKISGSTGEGSPFRLDNDEKERKDFSTFSVSPNGTVWFLLRADPNYYSVHFSSNGSPQSATKLQVPDYLEIPDQFAVNNEGVIFLRGYFGASAAEKLRGKRYAALLDASGKVIHTLSEGGDVDVQKIGLETWDGYVGAAANGRFYLFDPGKITILSPAGDVERTIPFSKPKPEQKIFKGEVSGGLIALWVSAPNKDEIWETQYLILDADTGEPRGVFAAPAAVGFITASCFSREQGFTSLQNSHSQLSLLRAKLP